MSKMIKKVAELPYRDNISSVVFKNKKFLLVQLTDWPENFWKFPQGGIDEGETDEKAVFRELKEELGTGRFRIVGKSKYTNKYDWPEEFLKKINYRWRGQIQRFYLVEFIGENKDIKIRKEEIREFKWLKRGELTKHIDHDNKFFTNYKNTIDKILLELKELIN